MMSLFFLAALVFVFVLLWRFEWAVVVLLFLLPSYLWRSSWFDLPTTFLEVMLILTVIVWAARFVQKKAPWPHASLKPLRLPLFGFLTASVIAMFVTPDPVAALGQFKSYLLEPLLFFVVFCDVAKQPIWRKRMVGALVCSGAIIGLIALGQFVTGWGIPDPWTAFPGRRAISLYPYPNAVGLYLAPLLMLSVGCAFFPRADFAPRRPWSVLASIVMFFAIAASVAEGAVVGVLAGAVFLAMFTSWRWKVLAALVLLLGLLFGLPASRNYLVPLLTFQDVSGDVRLALWQGTLRLLADRPWFGAGLAGFQTLYDQYRLAKHTELLLYPHNLFLNFWVELGLLGLLSMIGLLVQFFRKGWTAVRARSRDTQTRILMAVMVTTIVYGMVEVPFFKNDLAVLWWVMIGLMFAGENKTTLAKAARVV